MDIDVVIPTHNRAHTLARCLDSVLAQTMPAKAVLVVDDGSTDGTAELVAQYPQVQYHYQAQYGVSAARNVGIANSHSPWVALLDSDDEWLPNKLESQQQEISASGCFVCHTEEIWIRNGVRVNAKRKHRKQSGDIFLQSLALCAMSPSAILLHRSVLTSLGGFDPSFTVCEDYDLWLQISARYPVALVVEPMIKKYGGHADQLSRQYIAMDRWRVLAIEKLLATPDSGAMCLSQWQREALQQVRANKLSVLENGAKKHKNQSLIDFCSHRSAM